MDYLLSEKFKNLNNIARENHRDYINAEPFPNIVFNEFFDEKFLTSVLTEFPDLSKKKAIEYQNQNELKFAGVGETFFGKNTKILMNYLNSQPFLEFLNNLTGIEEKVIGDTYYIGGGQHEIKTGGYLKIHADFNKHKLFNLDRRINVLIYLNKNWKSEYGGYFELWNKSMKHCTKKILPRFNSVAIFSTTDYSYHGHPNPLTCPPNFSRKSLALYYYSNGRPTDEIDSSIGDHSTLFHNRKGIDKMEINKEMKKNYLKILMKDLLPPILIKSWKKIMNITQ